MDIDFHNYEITIEQVKKITIYVTALNKNYAYNQAFEKYIQNNFDKEEISDCKLKEIKEIKCEGAE